MECKRDSGLCLTVRPIEEQVESNDFNISSRYFLELARSTMSLANAMLLKRSSLVNFFCPPTSLCSPRWYSRGRPFCWWFHNDNFVMISKKYIKKDRHHDTPPADPSVVIKLQRVLAIGSHRSTCFTVKCSNDLDELLWDAACMLKDVPQRISIYQIVGLPKIDKSHVQGALKL